MAADLETIEHETGSDPLGTVIWLHGLGADAHDFEPAVPALAPGSGTPLRFIFPNAPHRPVTINQGVVMRAWYDISGFGRAAPEDAAGIEQSRRRLHGLIAREQARGMPPDRIVLAGFSQGAALSLHTALRYPESLAGMIALSTYLPLAARLPGEAHEANRATPVFIGHGDADPVVPLWLGRESAEQLRDLGYEVIFRTYPMMHNVVPAELQDVREFLLARLSMASGTST